MSLPPPLHESLRRCEILGTQVVAEPLDAVVSALDAVLESPARDAVAVCPVDAHTVLKARGDAGMRTLLNEASVTLADGMPLVFMAHRLGFHGAERARGTEVMWRILQRTAGTGARHFFYGGGDGIADALAARVESSLPGVRVAGAMCPPFRPLTSAEEADVVRRIHDSGAEVVWVGLSTPGQHRWVAGMRERLRVKLVCPVGAAFDYLTGGLRPAPPWMQRASLEWLFRLAQEPRRLGPRYAAVVPRFVALAGLQILRGDGRPRAGS